MLHHVRKQLRLTKPKELLDFIIQYGDDSVFPKLKLILSPLRASMGQDSLTDLTLLSIEKEETQSGIRKGGLRRPSQAFRSG